MLRELEYMRDLVSRYGTAHYIRKYFGFTLKEFASRMGVSQNAFCHILKRGLTKKHEDDFVRVFNEMDIEKRTKNHQESASNRQMREFSQGIRLRENA